jgi:autoinducer 2-degrading protein
MSSCNDSTSPPPTSIVVHFSVKAEYRSEWLALVASMCDSVLRTEPGAIQYRMLEDSKKANEFTLIERYKTHEDYLKHSQTEHFKEFLPNVLQNQKYYNQPLVAEHLKEINIGFYNYSAADK